MIAQCTASNIDRNIFVDKIQMNRKYIEIEVEMLS